MVNFTDKKLYLKGTCQVNVTDPCDGTVLYSSNKFQTANITTSSSLGEIRGGMGNSIATMIPSDSGVTVEFSAADFSLWAKAAQVGATLSYGAPTQTCVSVTADQNGVLTVETGEHGKPVAGLGYPAPFAYVQQVGATGTTGSTGKPYPITNDGTVTGYNGISGKEYNVTYYTWRVGAQVARIGAMFNSKVVHFTAQMPVFRNDACSAGNEGSRVGWLYVVVPRMKLGANGGIVGDQTTADTTSLSGQAVLFDDDPMEGCSSCNTGALAYYSYVPDNEAESIAGIAIVGGWMEVLEGRSTQIPVKIVMENGQLVTPGNYSDFVYTGNNPPEGTSISPDGIVTAGANPGDFEATVTYDNNGTTLTATVVISVVPIEVVGIVCEHNRIVVPESSSTQIKTLLIMSDGERRQPANYQTGFTYTAYNLPGDVTISSDGVITAGTTGGTGSVMISYTENGKTFTTSVPTEIEAAFVTGISITEDPIEIGIFASKQVPVIFNMSDGTTLVPDDYETGFTYRLEGAPTGATINESGVIEAGSGDGSCTVYVEYTISAGQTVTASAAVEIERAELPMSVDFIGSYSGTVFFSLQSSVNQYAYIDWGDGPNAERVLLTRGTEYKARHVYGAGVTSQRIRVYVPESGRSYALNPPVYGVESGEELVWGIGSLRTADIFKKLYYKNWTSNTLPLFKENPTAATVRNFTYVLPENYSTVQIPQNAFVGCTNLKTYTFLGTILSTIQASVFSGCAALETVDLSRVENVPTLSNVSAFSGTPASMQILVKESLVDQYKTATNWSAYASRIVGV